MSSPVRTRFAPSPTGFLHLGGARTALFCWAYARHHGGTFVLRIEDTDVARSTPQAVQAILDAMDWLGLAPDEGPFYQMQRIDRYRAVIADMLAAGTAYPCYSTPEEVDAMRERARTAGQKPRYDGTWRPEPGKTLPPVPAGRQPVIRFKNPTDGATTWDDLVKGSISIANAELDDFIIARADGTPTYNFCVVVDDRDMQITHVIRGDDHVNNTPRQINLLRALGADVPRYGHVPMILGPDGQKLSKRHGAVSVMDYEAQGYLPEAMVNYLARLGWSHGDDEVFSRDQLVHWFDGEHLSKSASQWDPKKLNWVNAQYLKQLDAAELAKHVVPRIEARGGKHIRSVTVQALSEQNKLTGTTRTLSCDVLAVSGGYSPVIHLQSQAGSKPVWNDDIAAFIPGVPVQNEISAGACNGLRTLSECAHDGFNQGLNAAHNTGHTTPAGHPPQTPETNPGSLRPLWQIPHPKGTARAPKQFVDLQNDVTAADLQLAVREGFTSIEHVKRYTALGFGTDQGKTGNINGMGIVAEALNKPIPEVGTTTFRPNYTPVTFGTMAGLELGDAFEPIRTTAIHDWHVQHGALFEDVGQWKRPWYYPKPGEDLHAAVKREVLAVRNGVGTLDASTLGKIDIQGPDASTLLNWIYCNAWSKLGIGKCRYGLMLDENGMVFDDGVTVRLAENHYLMHTTTGGAAKVLAWMERWLQTEWPHLKVYLTSVTDHWATTAVVGPKSRELLKTLCTDIDFDDDAFPFMSYREGTVAGIKARIMRISFSGERSYEVNVPAAHGLHVWEAIQKAGQPYGITPYGTETMHVLRAEKGYIIVGQDTDGSVSPIDLGMGGMVAKTKDCLGKRSLLRSDTASGNRKQLVGLLTEDPAIVLDEGAQIVESPNPTIPAPDLGHITSSYASPTLGRSIAMALVRNGLNRMDERVYVSMRDGRTVPATITGTVFFDPDSERQNA